jgi:hypothetical protein
MPMAQDVDLFVSAKVDSPLSDIDQVLDMNLSSALLPFSLAKDTFHLSKSAHPDIVSTLAFSTTTTVPTQNSSIASVNATTDLVSDAPGPSETGTMECALSNSDLVTRSTLPTHASPSLRVGRVRKGFFRHINPTTSNYPERPKSTSPELVTPRPCASPPRSRSSTTPVPPKSSSFPFEFSIPHAARSKASPSPVVHSNQPELKPSSKLILPLLTRFKEPPEMMEDIIEPRTTWGIDVLGVAKQSPLMGKADNVLLNGIEGEYSLESDSRFGIVHKRIVSVGTHQGAISPDSHQRVVSPSARPCEKENLDV